MSFQQLERVIVFDFLDLLIGFEELDFSMFEKIRVPNHVPKGASIFVVHRPPLSTHPPTVFTERFVELANGEIIGIGAMLSVAANVLDVGGTEGFGAVMVSGNEAHPPSMLMPRDDMTRSEYQIATDEDTGASPERTGMVVVCANPDLPNSAMGPNMETFVDLTLEDMLDWILVIGFEFTEILCVLALVTILWLALLGNRMFTLGTERRFITIGVFEFTSLTTFADFNWLEMASRLAGFIGRIFRTVMRFALLLLTAVIPTDSTPAFVISSAFRATLGALARFKFAGFSCGSHGRSER